MITEQEHAVSFRVEEIVDLFEWMCEGYHLGYIDIDTLKHMLEYISFFDENGVIWTIGVTSGKWYMWDGSSWTNGTPQGRLFQVYVEDEQEPEEEDNPIMRKLLKKV